MDVTQYVVDHTRSAKRLYFVAGLVLLAGGWVSALMTGWAQAVEIVLVITVASFIAISANDHLDHVVTAASRVLRGHFPPK